jgi:hypothetical protein
MWTTIYVFDIGKKNCFHGRKVTHSLNITCWLDSISRKMEGQTHGYSSYLDYTNYGHSCSTTFEQPIDIFSNDQTLK